MRYIAGGIGLFLLCVMGLTSCAGLGDGGRAEREKSLPKVEGITPLRWNEPQVSTETGINKGEAPLPHRGKVSEMRAWWQMWQDPLLLELIDSAEQRSPSLSIARKNIIDAHLARVGAQANLQPTVDAFAQSAREPNVGAKGAPLTTVNLVGVRPAWEIDLFGAGSALRDAADHRLVGAAASWHAARVSVAAETASLYNQWRNCHLQAQITGEIATSLSLSLAGLSQMVRSGLDTPNSLANAEAILAQTRNHALFTQYTCDVLIKSLVVLTGWGEPLLRERLNGFVSLGDKGGKVGDEGLKLLVPPFTIDVIPADTLSQRPDLAALHQDLLVVLDEIDSTRASRWPRLSLVGQIGYAQVRSDSVNSSTAWSLGPLQLVVPLWDGGVRKARIRSAELRYRESVVVYEAQVRQAVREVEQALLQVNDTKARWDGARTAEQSLARAEQSLREAQRAGLNSPLSVEEGRRARLNARLTTLQAQSDHNTSWLALYRAVGGSWDSTSPSEGTVSSVLGSSVSR